MRQNTQKEQKQDTEEVLWLSSVKITSYWSSTQYNDDPNPPISLKSLNGSKKAPDFKALPQAQPEV